jgi:hypothetical protein
MTIHCPKCNAENDVDYNAGDESLVCDECEAILLVNEDGSVTEC